MFEYLSAEQLAREAKTPDAHIVVIDSHLIGKRDLIDALSEGIESPYVDDNWDGLEEALRDLSWLPVPKVTIIHYGLPDLNDEEMEVYVDVLRCADMEWIRYRSEKEKYEGMGIKVCFDENLKTVIEKYISDIIAKKSSDKRFFKRFIIKSYEELCRLLLKWKIYRSEKLSLQCNGKKQQNSNSTKMEKIRIQLTKKEADYLGRLLSLENVSIKGLEDLYEIEINEWFAAAIREIVAHDLQIGGYFGDDGEPIDEDKVDIVESLIDKFFVE